MGVRMCTCVCVSMCPMEHRSPWSWNNRQLCHVDDGDQTQVLCKGSVLPQPPSHLPGPAHQILYFFLVCEWMFILCKNHLPGCFFLSIMVIKTKKNSTFSDFSL